MKLEIQCISKVNRFSPFEPITHVGGVYPNGTRWRMTQDEAIKAIETGRHTFEVRMPGIYGAALPPVRVEVAVSIWGNKYLKTEADTAEVNNLLSLPECTPVTLAEILYSMEE